MTLTILAACENS